MTMEKTKEMTARGRYARFGRWNSRITKLVRTQFVKQRDLSAVMDVLDRYYEVANPDIYAALQRFSDVRRDNAEHVLINGIYLHHTDDSVIALDLDTVLARVIEITGEA